MISTVTDVLSHQTLTYYLYSPTDDNKKLEKVTKMSDQTQPQAKELNNV